MTEKINPETWFIIKIYTFEHYVKFSFWVSVDLCELNNFGMYTSFQNFL